MTKSNQKFLLFIKTRVTKTCPTCGMLNVDKLDWAPIQTSDGKVYEFNSAREAWATTFGHDVDINAGECEQETVSPYGHIVKYKVISK